MDILQPYLFHHGPKHRTHRETQQCQSVKYSNVTHSLHQAFQNDSIDLPPVQSYQITSEVGDYWSRRYVFVLHQVVANPLSTLSIKEPGYLGSCLNESGTRATVRETARQHNCIFASNAGFFNTHNGHCLGNVVSDGKFVHNAGGVQNAHFGITNNGKLFTGYLSELDFLADGFKQLVGGVIWLVRDGEDYVDESIKLECSDTQETGNLNRFVNVISARTAIGHDRQGRVHIVQVNGLTDKAGVDLHGFAKLLISLGIVNAINLDGGGSATSIVNHTLVNFPSDKCPDKINNCERAVSSIVCVHYPACTIPDCSNNGVCDKGQCQCREPWMGEGCEVLDRQRCGSHGSWSNDGCECDAGWHGLNCSLPCPDGWYGRNCSNPCLCGNHGDCDIKTGGCSCHAGFTGEFCQKSCPFGFYGLNCASICFCQDSCFCDPVMGSCNSTHINTDFIKAGDCLVKHVIKRDNLVPDRHEQYSLCISSVACLCVIATASLILNAVFTYLLVKSRRENGQVDSNSLDSLELASSSTSFMSKFTKQGSNNQPKRFKRRKKRPRDQIINNNRRALLNGGVNRNVGANEMFYSLLRRDEEKGEEGEGRDKKRGVVNEEEVDEEGTVTGSGDDDDDNDDENTLFLARKKRRP